MTTFLATLSKSFDNLADAYRQACYRVLAEPSFVLRIDHPSPQLAAWHAANRVTQSAFLTAANPGSRRLQADENRVRHDQLTSSVKRFPSASGRGEDPNGDWPDEPSLLVGGMTLSEARELARRFGQNAFVHARPDALPRLIWTNEEEN